MYFVPMCIWENSGEAYAALKVPPRCECDWTSVNIEYELNSRLTVSDVKFLNTRMFVCDLNYLRTVIEWSLVWLLPHIKTLSYCSFCDWVCVWFIIILVFLIAPTLFHRVPFLNSVYFKNNKYYLLLFKLWAWDRKSVYIYISTLYPV